jgi:hypothetical protein
MVTEPHNILAEETQLVDSPALSSEIDLLSSVTSEESHEVEEIDYKTWSKEALTKAFKECVNADQVLTALKLAGKLKTSLEEKIQEEKHLALEKFLSEGGIEEDFEYKGEALLTEVEKDFKLLRSKQKNFLNDLNRKKQENYQVRLGLLEKLRLLMDGQKSISFKHIQEEWKKASPVPQEYNEELWASFNALANRYYDNRTIDFELKELDKKKNLELKIELCLKAELLHQETSINKSLETLNFLHREYKHTGPVPDDQKEAIWQRFKVASDALYARRDEHLKVKQAEYLLNLEKKKEFLSKLEPFATFTADSTDAWKQKITELDSLQKEWASIGFSGKEEIAKEVGKKYWELVKTFYKHKNEHYKKVYTQLSENLKKKEALCELAESLATEEDLDKAGKTVIDLQKKWKEIGHVPFKIRDKIFERFKKACDEVFNRKRGIEKVKDSEYEENLVKKLTLCDQIATLDASSKENLALFKQLLAEWKSIGFVPRKEISQVQAKYSAAVQKFLNGSKQNEEEKRKIKLSLEMDDIRSKPDAKILLHKKEQTIRGKIKSLQTEIDTLNNNLLFFSRSKNASTLAKEVESKVELMEKQIDSLKDELQLIQSS